MFYLWGPRNQKKKRRVIRKTKISGHLDLVSFKNKKVLDYRAYMFFRKSIEKALSKMVEKDNL
ncbi:MAG: hypothetical protein FH753_01945 [Firmicutes bacterium]|nr:hypothetical protein [Bacillota bacterium]